MTATAPTPRVVKEWPFLAPERCIGCRCGDFNPAHAAWCRMCGGRIFINRWPPCPRPGELPFGYLQRVGTIEVSRPGGYRAPPHSGEVISAWQAGSPPLLLRDGSFPVHAWPSIRPLDRL